MFKCLEWQLLHPCGHVEPGSPVQHQQHSSAGTTDVGVIPKIFQPCLEQEPRMLSKISSSQCSKNSQNVKLSDPIMHDRDQNVAEQNSKLPGTQQEKSAFGKQRSEQLIKCRKQYRVHAILQKIVGTPGMIPYEVTV